MSGYFTDDYLVELSPILLKPTVKPILIRRDKDDKLHKMDDLKGLQHIVHSINNIQGIMGIQNMPITPSGGSSSMPVTPSGMSSELPRSIQTIPVHHNSITNSIQSNMSSINIPSILNLPSLQDTLNQTIPSMHTLPNINTLSNIHILPHTNTLPNLHNSNPPSHHSLNHQTSLTHLPSQSFYTPSNRSMSIVSIDSPLNSIVLTDDIRPTRNNSTTSLVSLAQEAHQDYKRKSEISDDDLELESRHILKPVYRSKNHIFADHTINSDYKFPTPGTSILDFLASAPDPLDSPHKKVKAAPATPTKTYLKKIYLKELQNEIMGQIISPPGAILDKPRRISDISEQNKLITKLNQKWNKSMLKDKKIPEKKDSRKRSRGYSFDADNEVTVSDNELLEL